MKRTRAAVIAQTIDAYHRCVKNFNSEWSQKHCDTIGEFEKQLPHGSGLDGMVKFNVEKSSRKKIIVDTEYHHMNDVDYYCGWSQHSVIVTPAFDGVDVKVTGRNRNRIKEHLHEIFQVHFSEEYKEVK